jgi:hypothetical protein
VPTVSLSLARAAHPDEYCYDRSTSVAAIRCFEQAYLKHVIITSTKNADIIYVTGSPPDLYSLRPHTLPSYTKGKKEHYGLSENPPGISHG